jgi:hypothetical protein
MKLTATLLFLIASIAGTAQVFNFHGTEYFLAPDETSEPGTELTASGTNLSSFNFSNAPSDHPLFATGIYYPVTDCGDQNLWVRVQHIAHDPNGTENGFNISQTLNSPFLPIGSPDRIGGWAGFLYDFQIFADQNLIGARTNVLAAHQPAQIIVESLETLYNDGGTMFEWLAFEILNPESDGWQLLSTSFTGINPFSNPGFSGELAYSTPVSFGQAPAGFTTEFPSGSPTVYAVDLNLSAAYHSEFRMSASDVSHFRYGYEFTTGGYQGMSMAFGGSPSVYGTITHDCGFSSAGIIVAAATGTPPFTYEWGNDQTGPELDGLAAGEYTVTVTDALNCSGEATFTVLEGEAVNVEIDADPLSGDVLQLTATGSGGTGTLSYEWSTEQTGPVIQVNSPNSYSVTVTDEIGCSANASFDYVGLEELSARGMRIYPNPASERLTILSAAYGGEVRIFSATGQLVENIRTTGENLVIDVSEWPAGVYTLRYQSADGNLAVRAVSIVR